jgi:hypothetical protein
VKSERTPVVRISGKRPSATTMVKIHGAIPGRRSNGSRARGRCYREGAQSAIAGAVHRQGECVGARGLQELTDEDIGLAISCQMKPVSFPDPWVFCRRHRCRGRRVRLASRKSMSPFTGQLQTSPAKVRQVDRIRQGQTTNAYHEVL